MARRQLTVSYLRIAVLLALIASLDAPRFRIWRSCDVLAGDRSCGYTYVHGFRLVWGDFVLICSQALLVLMISHLRGRASPLTLRLDFDLTWVALVWIGAAGIWHAYITIRGNGIGHTSWGAGVGFVLALAQIVLLGCQIALRSRREHEIALGAHIN